MSVINQMLQDLEKRSRSKQSIDFLSGLRPINNVKWKGIFVHRWFRIMLGSFIPVLCLLVLLAKMHHPHPRLMKAGALAPVQTFFLPPMVESREHIVPTILTGVTLQIQNHLTDLHFSLSQNVLYHLYIDAPKNQLILILEHARFLLNLPFMNDPNSALLNMTLVNLPSGDLKIVLHLKSAVELNYLDLLASNTPELRLQLLSHDVTPLVQKPVIVTKKIVKLRPPSVSLPKPVIIQKKPKRSVMNLLDNALAVTKPPKIPAVESIEEKYKKVLSEAFDDTNQQKTIQALTALVTQYPDFKPAQESLAEIRARNLANTGAISDALEMLRSHQPTLTDNPDYHAFMAALYQKQGDGLMSAKLYEQLVQLNQPKAVWWIGLGVALESLGKQNEADHSYSQALMMADLTPELKAFIATRLHAV